MVVATEGANALVSSTASTHQRKRQQPPLCKGERAPGDWSNQASSAAPDVLCEPLPGRALARAETKCGPASPKPIVEVVSLCSWGRLRKLAHHGTAEIGR